MWPYSWATHTHRLDSKNRRNYNFPRYFKYSLQIDPESTHNQLYKLGYFTKNKTLSYLTVVELKTILSKHNLATSGKKQN